MDQENEVEIAKKLLAEEGDDKMITYYFVRHGQTELNEKHIVQGSKDGKLTKLGKEQADMAGEILSEVAFDLVVTGGAGRHFETANRILSKNKVKRIVPSRICKGFREQYYGIFDGGLEEDYHKARESEDEDTFFGLHKVERPETVKLRALEEFKRLEKALPDGTNVLIASSGGVLNLLLGELIPQLQKDVYMYNGGVTTIESHDDMYKLVSFNVNSAWQKGDGVI